MNSLHHYHPSRDNSDASTVFPDYLTFSGRGIVIAEFMAKLVPAMRLEPYKLEAVHRDHGALGWTDSTLISYDGALLASVLHGGESQRGVVRVEMKGAACQMVKNWQPIYDYLFAHDLRITRIDLAADLLTGERTVEQALDDWRSGGFTSSTGKPPSMKQFGNWDKHDGTGRTLYVGSRANGKLWRIYEKGCQLGLAFSAWVRWELELRAVERIIPLDVLLRPADYYTGAAPVAASIVQGAAEKIRGIQRAAVVRLDVILHHARRSYGQLLQYLHMAGVNDRDVVRAISRPIGEKRIKWQAPVGISIDQVIGSCVHVGI